MSGITAVAQGNPYSPDFINQYRVNPLACTTRVPGYVTGTNNYPSFIFAQAAYTFGGYPISVASPFYAAVDTNGRYIASDGQGFNVLAQATSINFFFTVLFQSSLANGDTYAAKWTLFPNTASPGAGVDLISYAPTTCSTSEVAWSSSVQINGLSVGTEYTIALQMIIYDTALGPGHGPNGGNLIRCRSISGHTTNGV